MSDNSFSISTSHNVDISYDKAGIGERILARIIDRLIIVGYVFAVAIVLFAVFQIQKYHDSAAAVVIFIFAMPIIFYTLIFETFMQGQTPGKRARKIKVVRIDGEQASFSAYLIRWLFQIVDSPIYGVVGILCIVLSKKGQRVGDMIAQTTVIKLTDATSLRDTIYERIHVDHTVTYPEVRVLTEAEVEMVKKVLNTDEYRQNYDMLYTLTNKIQAKMNVTRREASPEEFLRTVVRDYNALED